AANAVLVGTIHGEERHPISRPLMRLYHPVVGWVLRHRWATVTAAALVVAITAFPFSRLKSEFMPSLNEGTILYMPTALPGMSISCWMPVQTRTFVLATGFRSPVGIKGFGPDLEQIGRIGQEVEGVLATLPGTRSAFAERTTGGYYLDFTVRRDAIARYGLTV